MAEVNRKGKYKRWRHRHAGYCRRCGNVYVPARSGTDGDQSGDVEEMEYCSNCALHCPTCGAWLTAINVVVRGWWRYHLRKNEETGKFHIAGRNAPDDTLRRPQCPYCGHGLDPDLVEF